MLTIKTGLASEAKIARVYALPGTSVLSGVQSVADLHNTVPFECAAVISFGLCGGLAPEAEIGQIFIANVLVTPKGEYRPNAEWGARLLARTKGHECNWWSSGLQEANDLAERTALFARTGCSIIDDETFMVAQFAEERGIAWQAMRAVSDCVACVIPPAAQNALRDDGELRIEHVLKSVLTDPTQIPSLIRLWSNFYKSLGSLSMAAGQVGPSFQWDGTEESYSPHHTRSLCAPAT